MPVPVDGQPRNSESKLGYDIFEPVVAEGGASFHPRLEHRIAYLARRIGGGDRQAGLPVLFGEDLRYNRFAVGEWVENLGVNEPLWRIDLEINTVEPDRAAGIRPDEMPLAAWAEVDLAHADPMLVIEDAPPTSDVLGLRHGLEHKAPGGIEQARQGDLAIRRGRDLESVAICGAADGHVSSPLLAVHVDSRRVDRAAVPRCG